MASLRSLTSLSRMDRGGSVRAEASPGGVWASGGCRIIKCGFIVDLIKGLTLGGSSGEAGGDWA